MFPPPPPGVSHTHVLVIFVFTCFYGVFFLSTTLIFLLYGLRDQRLSKRSVWLTCIGGFSNTVASVIFLFSFAFLQSWPCYLDFIGCYLGLVPAILTIIFRSARLVLISWHQESLLRRRLGSTSSSTTWFAGLSQAIIERRLGFALSMIMIVDLAYVIITLLTDRYDGTVGVTSVAVWPVISYQCTPAIELYPFYIFLGLVCVGFGPVSVYFLYNIQDGYGIRKALIHTLAAGLLSYTLYFLWIPLNLARFHEYWSAALFPVIACLSIHITSIIIPLWQLRRDNIRQANINTLPDADEFDRMLSNPVMFAKFCQHCAQDFSAENTRFVEDYQLLKFMAMESFKNLCEEREEAPEISMGVDYPLYSRNLSETSMVSPLPSSPTIYNIPPPSVSISQAIADFLPETFKEIKEENNDQTASIEVPERLRSAYFSFYSTFIKTEGMLEANLPAYVTSRVREQIQVGEYTLDMFELAKKEILHLLLFNAFPRFLDQIVERHSTSSSRSTRKDKTESRGSDTMFIVNI